MFNSFYKVECVWLTQVILIGKKIVNRLLFFHPTQEINNNSPMSEGEKELKMCQTSNLKIGNH